MFTVAYSPNGGNNPYPYLERSGLLKKWADRYHLEIKLERLDYSSAIEAFAGKKVEACVMSNMESLEIPATSGIDTTLIYVNDSSNGNDMILARNGLELKDLSGKRTLLAQKSISLYLLERAMRMQDLEPQIPGLKVIDAPADGLPARFLKDPAIDVVVTWKPMASQILAGAKVKDLFNSSQIPGEIVHFLAVRTEVIDRPDGSGDRFAKALTGAWYEVMTQLLAPATQGEAVSGMASGSENTPESVNDQLKTTRFYMEPRQALHFANGGITREKMRAIRRFCFEHKLLGTAQSPDDVAIEYPDKTVEGNRDHVRLHLVSRYMLLAAVRAL